jgi:hypothetical protein
MTYKPLTGRTDLAPLNAFGPEETMLATRRPVGFTHMLSFTVKTRPHVFAYEAGTGETYVDRIDPCQLPRG